MLVLLGGEYDLGIGEAEDDLAHDGEAECDDQQLERPEAALETEEVLLLLGELPFLYLVLHGTCRSTRIK
jgi:hypothetical protein